MDNAEVSIKDKYVLMNVTEELVKKQVSEVMKHTDMCQCEKCFLDTCAIVLNSLKAHYVTTRKGELLTRLTASELQNKTDMAFSVLSAIRRVKNSPNH